MAKWQKVEYHVSCTTDVSRSIPMNMDFEDVVVHESHLKDLGKWKRAETRTRRSHISHEAKCLGKQSQLVGNSVLNVKIFSVILTLSLEDVWRLEIKNPSTHGL